MKTSLTVDSFESLAGGAQSKSAPRSTGNNPKRIAELGAELAQRRAGLRLSPDFQAALRAKRQAGLDEKTALEVLLKEHSRDIYCQMEPRDAAELLVVEFEPRLPSLKELSRSFASGGFVPEDYYGPLPADVEQELADPLAGATMLAQSIFKGRQDSRIREALTYLDRAGNNTLRRIEIVVELFTEYLKDTETPPQTPTS